MRFVDIKILFERDSRYRLSQQALLKKTTEFIINSLTCLIIINSFFLLLENPLNTNKQQVTIYRY